MWASGPHIGVISDIELYKRYPPPLDANESLMADAGYSDKASSSHLIYPIKKLPGKPRSREAMAYNKLLSGYRVTIEHSFGYLKRFAILKHYRGRVLQNMFFQHCIKVLLHICAYEISVRPRRQLKSIVDDNIPVIRPHYVGDDADASVIANEEVAVIEENNDQIIGDEDNDDFSDHDNADDEYDPRNITPTSGSSRKKRGRKPHKNRSSSASSSSFSSASVSAFEFGVFEVEDQVLYKDTVQNEELHAIVCEIDYRSLTYTINIFGTGRFIQRVEASELKLLTW